MSGQVLVIHHQQLELLPQKAIYWHNTQTLIVSDIHLGKASHFRKHGLALPLESGLEDLRMLDALLLSYQPKRLLLLGDLFHSEYNLEWNIFGTLRRKHEEVRFHLVVGNHDILTEYQYEKYAIQLHPEAWVEDGLVFSHQKIEISDDCFSISGHIHPGFKLYGKGRQSLALPCFYKEKNALIMPAFGRLTGLALLPRTSTSEVFVLTEDAVYRV